MVGDFGDGVDEARTNDNNKKEGKKYRRSVGFFSLVFLLLNHFFPASSFFTLGGTLNASPLTWFILWPHKKPCSWRNEMLGLFVSFFSPLPSNVAQPNGCLTEL